MNVGILGTGDVGKALGRGFVTLGHAVKMGARDGRNEKAVTKRPISKMPSVSPRPFTIASATV